MAMEDLKGEQKRAFSTFYNLYQQDHSQLFIESVQELDSIYWTDTFFFTYQILQTTNLPKESWAWNRSKKSVSIILDTQEKVTFYKLNNRKKKHTSLKKPHVNCKIWIFKVESNSKPVVYCFWCEVGVSRAEVLVKLNDLTFLVDFVSSETAEQLGWQRL